MPRIKRRLKKILLYPFYDLNCLNILNAFFDIVIDMWEDSGFIIFIYLFFYNQLNKILNNRWKRNFIFDWESNTKDHEDSKDKVSPAIERDTFLVYRKYNLSDSNAKRL